MLKRLYCLFLSFSIALTPMAGADAGRVFEQARHSVVVVRASDGQGSGVVVGEGLVITNCHVVGNEVVVKIERATDAQGTKPYIIEAHVVARDDDNDLCLLLTGDLTQPPAAKIAKLGAAKSLKIGEEVYAIGAPEELVLSLSRGIVTQLRGVNIKGKAPIVQTDATIGFGSSGGGLFNKNGELIGIPSFGPEDNINFAMPVEMVSDLIQSYRNEAKTKEAQSNCIKAPQYQCILILSRQAARQISDYDNRAQAMISIAKAQALAGFFNDAKKTAHQVPTDKLNDSADAYIDDYSTDHASDILDELVADQLQKGDIESAHVIAMQIDDSKTRDLALSDISYAQAQEKRFKDAEKTAQQIESAEQRGHALVDIVAAQAQMGDIKGAEKTTQQISGVSRAWALAEIAAAQAQAGYSSESNSSFDNALQAANKISDNALRSESLGFIANAQAYVGNEKAKVTFQDAVNTAKRIDTTYARAMALSEIASVQAQSEDINGAKITVKEIDYFSPRNKALKNIAIAQAESGDIKGAMQTAQLIDDNQEKIAALAGIAEALAEQ